MIRFKVEFIGHGASVEPAPGRLVLDTGNRLVPGVIDHHQDSTDLDCTATLVVRRPELVLEHLGTMPLEDVVFVLHDAPDFDAVSSAYLAAALIERRELPQAAALAEYALHVDQATLPPTHQPANTPYGIYCGIARVVETEAAAATPDERSYRMLERGLALIDFMHNAACQGRSVYDEKLFKGKHPFAAEQGVVREDYWLYLEDLQAGEVFAPVRLECIGGQGHADADLLVVKDPAAALFKVWARQDATNSPHRHGFTMLCVQYGASRFVISTEPRASVWLKGLGAALDRAETAKRALLGVPREGPPRPGYANSDPWYDGRAAVHNYTIVDAPRAGTVLTRDEVLALVLHPASWD